MEGLRRSIGWPAAALVLTCTVLVMMPTEASASRFIVGANMGWTSNVNYAIWTKGKHFHLGDWLFFVYDRHHVNVLEVNKRDYMNCNSNHPLHNWTAGAGRDVVPLYVTKTYYFISGKGFCRRGMKVTIRVEKPQPRSSTFNFAIKD
ncbi:unnamed protein product [Fraxinus pennsylvanica]|uniref:Phytocyanin domain-containing protein n=1 Tax=Fraxinus pennsylvanica TaxID=56036 RepID=A0AAD1Z6I6_9LAMI|nr:unnamed protein product [Fraxinus pennsylvanica]